MGRGKKQLKSIEIVSDVVSEANGIFSPEWVMNDDKYRQLEKCCAHIDFLVKDFGASILDVTIDEDEKTIIISIICSEFILDMRESPMHPIFELFENADVLSIRFSGIDAINVEFVLPSIWEKK